MTPLSAESYTVQCKNIGFSEQMQNVYTPLFDGVEEELRMSLPAGTLFKLDGDHQSGFVEGGGLEQIITFDLQLYDGRIVSASLAVGPTGGDLEEGMEFDPITITDTHIQKVTHELLRGLGIQPVLPAEMNEKCARDVDAAVDDFLRRIEDGLRAHFGSDIFVLLAGQVDASKFDGEGFRGVPMDIVIDAGQRTKDFTLIGYMDRTKAKGLFFKQDQSRDFEVERVLEQAIEKLDPARVPRVLRTEDERL